MSCRRRTCLQHLAGSLPSRQGLPMNRPPWSSTARHRRAPEQLKPSSAQHRRRARQRRDDVPLVSVIGDERVPPRVPAERGWVANESSSQQPGSASATQWCASAQEIVNRSCPLCGRRECQADAPPAGLLLTNTCWSADTAQKWTLGHETPLRWCARSIRDQEPLVAGAQRDPAADRRRPVEPGDRRPGERGAVRAAGTQHAIASASPHEASRLRLPMSAPGCISRRESNQNKDAATTPAMSIGLPGAVVDRQPTPSQ